jgi:hypothetical protein
VAGFETIIREYFQRREIGSGQPPEGAEGLTDAPGATKKQFGFDHKADSKAAFARLSARTSHDRYRTDDSATVRRALSMCY